MAFGGRRLECRQDFRLPVLFHELPEGDDRLWLVRALVQAAELFVHERLGLPTSRYVAYFGHELVAENPANGSVREHDRLYPASPPHLPMLSGLVQMAPLVPLAANHVSCLLSWFARYLPLGAQCTGSPSHVQLFPVRPSM